MFEGLKSALGLSTPAPSTDLSGVDAVTHQMLQDLHLPDPDRPAGGVATLANHHDALEEAREQVEDWLAEGQDIEQELDIVFEALFDSETQARAYLSSAKGAGFVDDGAMATRKFADSIAATILVSMIPAPEDLVRIELMLAPLATQAGGTVDGYYLDGQADPD